MNKDRQIDRQIRLYWTGKWIQKIYLYIKDIQAYRCVWCGNDGMTNVQNPQSGISMKRMRKSAEKFPLVHFYSYFKITVFKLHCIRYI